VPNHFTNTIVTNSGHAKMTGPSSCHQNELEARPSVTSSQTLPLVTLAVTTFNRPDYLRETLSSVLAQDYPNLEILVSDNGSSDETPVLARALINNDGRARFRRNDTTVPLHQHFTQCVHAARGEFFILLCDDDRIDSRFVSELVAVTTRHPELNVVVPANLTIDEHGSVVEKFATPEGEVFDAGEFVCRWLYSRPPKLFASVITVLTRTDVLRRFGGYHGLAGGRNNDNLLFLQCAVAGRVGFAHRALFNSRIHNRSYGANATPRQVAESSRQFLSYLRHDPCTVKILGTLSAARRKQVIDGVRYMTALELIFHIKFLRQSVWREMLSGAVPMYRWDSMFCLAVLRQYYRDLRAWLKRIFLSHLRDVAPVG
jgi:glycosyltransferase involved in cell wall biosynthesis